MNKLSSLQRKIIYLVSIAVLAVPIIWLGQPGDDKNAGGRLDELRREHDLGESNLGDIDPSSATINLVLVGLRGIAVNQLWIQASHHQETKNWAQLESNINSIILLQPHYVKVWEYQGWNLAYNVSAEWDLVKDKYYWIKQGAKFSIQGTERNKNEAELYWWVGVILGDKIARHDAGEYMRKFFNPNGYKPTTPSGKPDPFRGDPEIRKNSNNRIINPDPQLNPGEFGRDNYLVAKDWFLKANEADKIKEQRRMAIVAFRQRPARAQMAYAEMFQKEGRFDDIFAIQDAWKTGHKEWTEDFGKEMIKTYFAGHVQLEGDIVENYDRQIQEDKEKNLGQTFTVHVKGLAREGLRKVANYVYWRSRALVESNTNMINAHHDIYEGKIALKRWKPQQARKDLEKGLNAYAKLLEKNSALESSDEVVEEVMIAILAWQDLHRLLSGDPNIQKKLPVTDPSLAAFWSKHAAQRDDYQRLLQRELADISEKLQ